MQTSAGETADEFERSMSTLAAHEMLRTKLAAMPQPGGLHLYNAAGRLINATEIWPVPDVEHRGPALLQGVHVGQGRRPM